MPMYCLIVFGCYALAKIGLGLIAFKDCSEDAALLDQVRMFLRTHAEKISDTFVSLLCLLLDFSLAFQLCELSSL